MLGGIGQKKRERENLGKSYLLLGWCCEPWFLNHPLICAFDFDFHYDGSEEDQEPPKRRSTITQAYQILASFKRRSMVVVLVDDSAVKISASTWGPHFFFFLWSPAWCRWKERRILDETKTSCRLTSLPHCTPSAVLAFITHE